MATATLATPGTMIGKKVIVRDEDGDLVYATIVAMADRLDGLETIYCVKYGPLNDPDCGIEAWLTGDCLFAASEVRLNSDGKLVAWDAK